MSTSAPSRSILGPDPLGLQRRLVGDVHTRARSSFTSTFLAGQRLAGLSRSFDVLGNSSVSALTGMGSAFAEASADRQLRAATDQLRGLGLYSPPGVMSAQLGIADAIRGFTSPVPAGIGPHLTALGALCEAVQPRIAISPVMRSSPLATALEALREASTGAPLAPLPARRPLVLDEHQARQQTASLAVDLAEDPVALAAAQQVLDRPELREVVDDPRVRREAARLADRVWPPSTGLVVSTAAGTAAVLTVVLTVLTLSGHGAGAGQFLGILNGALLSFNVLGAYWTVKTMRESTRAASGGPQPGDEPAEKEAGGAPAPG